MYSTKQDQKPTVEATPASPDRGAPSNDGRIVDRIVREAMLQSQEPPEMPTLELKTVKPESGASPEFGLTAHELEARGNLVECFKLMGRCSRLWMQMRIVGFSPSRRLRSEAATRKREIVRELITCYERLIYHLHQLNLCDEAD